MKKVILGLAMFGVISAQAEVKVGDSVVYGYSNGKTETVRVISVEDFGPIPILMKMKKSEDDSKILSERLMDIEETAKALENCDPVKDMPVKGEKREIEVEAGVFNACHYVIQTGAIAEERYLSKDVPFFLVKRAVYLDGESVSKELKSFEKR